MKVRKWALAATLFGLIAVALPKAAWADGTFADVAGVPGCTPTSSSATPAIVTCGTVGAGTRGGSASANFNLLGASASSGSAIGNVISNAQFTDTVTFTPTITGTVFLGFVESLSGTITGTGGGASASGLFTASYNDTTICSLPTNQTAFSLSCFALTPALAVTAGVSQQGTLMGSLTAQAKFGANTVADFSDTAFISAVNLYDANMNLIGPIQLTGASGTTYGSASSAVPEPSSLLLLGTGLFALIGIGFLRARPA